MAFQVIDCDQRSQAWWAARLGCVTSSDADKLTMEGRKKGEPSKTQEAYRVRLALERVTGRAQESTLQTAAMTFGTETEPEALSCYEARTGDLLAHVGFLRHPDLMAGTSPDAVLIGDGGAIVGGVECKVPLPHNHLAYLRQPSLLTSEYAAQIRHHLWITGAPWWDAISYNPAFPDALKLLVVRVVRDEEQMSAHELAVRLFLGTVEKEADAILALAGRAA